MYFKEGESMSKVWVSSDLHFGHGRQFIWGPRGFQSIDEHDTAIIERWNSVVAEDDEVYLLGDLMLNDNIHGIECIKKLNGRLHFIAGNHDTDTRIDLYQDAGLEYLGDARRIRYKGYHFYLSHFPTLTGNLEAESLKQCSLNLFGHTHQKTNFYEDRPYMYHVGLDSHNCYPVLLDDIIEEMHAKVKECLAQL